ncbi:sugar porter (SP) family MFS transporter [Mycolicibacterium sp. BK556]|uniref:sugar porter family MFS transporter n=1 Tax=unclassified Mycolicibacterium TaxID=2636767 RepID=UPI0016159A8F|nr:sugar porter (SP) family MFS transporter [Mycolicibacterium sp. BK556]MBB3633486.1 sugar porter (SP) family MFS transporter [Mycolicibacterium sp. BK607]MBB3751068.1 sugar porter (SP) family MFS transporter [Mycolicibacterium sp. BK634]
MSVAPQSSQGPTPLAALLAAVAAIAGFLIGYHTGVIAGALEFIGEEFHLGDLARGAVVTAVLVGGLVGGIAGGPLARRLGQRPALMITAVVFAVCAAGSAWAAGPWVLGAWRFGLGLAVGGATMVAPLYVAETAPSRWRGALVSAFQLAITSGILVSYLVGLAFTGSGDWRMMLGLGLIPAVLLLIGLVFLPESPRWLLLAGREDEARKAWNALSREPWSEDDISVIRAGVGQGHGRFRDLLTRRMRPALIIAAGLFVFTNLSGIDAILYYAPVIFREVGLGETGPILATVGLGTINVLATVLAMWLVDRVGRRPLLLCGLAPMAISLVIMSACLLLDSSVGGLATIVCLAIFIFAFAVSLGPLPYVLMSEIFPSAVRPLGMAVAAATAWGVNAVVSVSFLPLAGAIGMSGTFFVFAGVCAVAFVFVYRLVPETKGRTLEEIERSLLHAG